MSHQRIVVVGSSNTDMIIKLDHIPKPGETILGGAFLIAAGGKGANQAVGAARAGGAVTFIARVGRDMFGEQAVAGFARDGINVDYVFRDRASPSGVALIFVARDGENSIAVASGANGRLAPADVKKAKKVFADARVLVMQLETPLETVQTAAELARRAGVQVVLNPAPARPLPDALLRNVSILTPNESEAELLTGLRVDDDRAAVRAADQLLARGVQTVILTLGARGAFVATGADRRLVPGFKMKAVDTTAAGDIFNGALAVALAEGKPLAEAVRFANAAAAISVTRMGAQPSAPRRREIERLLARGAGPRRRRTQRTQRVGPGRSRPSARCAGSRTGGSRCGPDRPVASWRADAMRAVAWGRSRGLAGTAGRARPAGTPASSGHSRQISRRRLTGGGRDAIMKLPIPTRIWRYGRCVWY